MSPRSDFWKGRFKTVAVPLAALIESQYPGGSGETLKEIVLYFEKPNGNHMFAPDTIAQATENHVSLILYQLNVVGYTGYSNGSKL